MLKNAAMSGKDYFLIILFQLYFLYNKLKLEHILFLLECEYGIASSEYANDMWTSVCRADVSHSGSQVQEQEQRRTGRRLRLYYVHQPGHKRQSSTADKQTQGDSSLIIELYLMFLVIIN